MTKNRLKRGENSDIYLIHACRMLQSIKSPERTFKKQEDSVNTVAFISCSRLTTMPADGTMGRVRMEGETD